MSRTARPVPWSCMNRSLPDARPSMLRPGSEVSSLGARAERTPHPLLRTPQGQYHGHDRSREAPFDARSATADRPARTPEASAQPRNPPYVLPNTPPASTPHA